MKVLDAKKNFSANEGVNVSIPDSLGVIIYEFEDIFKYIL